MCSVFARERSIEEVKGSSDVFEEAPNESMPTQQPMSGLQFQVGVERGRWTVERHINGVKGRVRISLG